MLSSLFSLSEEVFPDLEKTAAPLGEVLSKALSIPGKTEGLRGSRNVLFGESPTARTVLDALYDYIVRPVSKKMQESNLPFLRSVAPRGPDPFGTPLAFKRLSNEGKLIDKAYNTLNKAQIRALAQNTLGGAGTGAVIGAVADESPGSGALKGALAGSVAGGLVGAARAGTQYKNALDLARKAGGKDLSYASMSEIGSRGLGGIKLRALERDLREMAVRELHDPFMSVPGIAAGSLGAALPIAISRGTKKEERPELPSFSRF